MKDSQVAKRDATELEYIPLGCQSKITISVGIVQNLIAIPTKSRKTCSRADALKFIAMCYARRMNPFTGDCFLQGYDTANGPKFEFITAYQALITRAEQSPHFDGLAHGVIVKEEGKILELKGDFYDDSQELVGGWAMLKRKDRSLPFEDRVKLKTFIKTNERGEPIARWKIDPGGMIVKCASASVCREAFPTACGGLYTGDEVGIIGEGLGMMATPEPESAQTSPPEDDNSNTDLAPATASTTKPKPDGEPLTDSPQAKLAALASENGLTFDAYQRWGEGSGNDEQASSRGNWSEIPAELCNRFLRAKAGFISGLKGAMK